MSKVKYPLILAAVFATSCAMAQEAATATVTAAPEAKPVEAAQPAEMKEASDVSFLFEVEVLSSAIYKGGGILNDSLVIQPYAEVGFKAFDAIPLTVGVWANYATDKYGAQTQNHCFTEVDLAIGTAYKFDSGLKFELSFESWQYPNMEGWNGEEAIIPTISFDFLKFFTVGTRIEYLLTGDADGDISILPFVKAAYSFTDDLSASVMYRMHYKRPDGEGAVGWGNGHIYTAVSFKNFSAYARWWIQIDDDVYVDDVYHDKHFVYGLGYSTSF